MTSPQGQRRLPFTDPDRMTQINGTLDLIEQGGPFPFPQDDQPHRNIPRRLPARPLGYYREYTVVTPGAGFRSDRRIVVGAVGETYYTDDHYRSFVRIDPRRY